MSLEKKVEGLIEATTNLIDCTTALLDKKTQRIAEEEEEAIKLLDAKPKSKTEKADKKAEKELKLKVKETAATLMKEKGKDVLTKLLSEFGVTKVSDLKPGCEVYPDFIRRAEALLEEPEASTETEDAEDLLGDEEPSKTEITMDDVKAKLKAVQDHEDLGRNFVAGILDACNVKFLRDLKPKKFAEAIELADKELAKV